MGVAKFGEGGRLVVVVTHFLVQLEGPPVVGDGLGMPAEPVVDVAEAVQAGRLPVAVVEFPLQGKGLKAGGEGLPVFAEQRLQPADVVERPRLPDPVAYGFIKALGLPVVLKSPAVVAALSPHVAQVVVGVGLPFAVAGLLGQLEGPGEVEVGMVEVGLAGVGVGKVAVCGGLGERIGHPIAVVPA